MKKLILICLLASSLLQAQVIKLGNITLNKGGKGDTPSFTINGEVVEDGDDITSQLGGVSAGHKFLTASEVGLVSSPSVLLSSPFTAQEYLDARNNGINLSNAIIQAYNDGFTGVILERGNYTLTGNRGTTIESVGNNGYAIHIQGIHNFEINFNGSTLFVLYDSNNRNPYDTTSDPIHELTFKLINFRESSFVTVKNLELRGDNYMRSWITGEENDIGCYGITLDVNSQNFKIENYEGHGFRCESLAVSYGGFSDLKLNVWDYGGVDDVGVDQVEVGAFRTPLRDITTMTVVNNSVSIVGWGFTREIKFRNSKVRIFYYDISGTFISSEETIQNKLNYLPTGTRYCRVVAYDDERTVSEGETHYNYCSLTSGTPRNLEVVNSTFYNNMRGGIAGVANNTIIRNCVFHTIGEAIGKYGWLYYGDTTKFAIDIEDGMPDFVEISNNRFENVGHAVLTPACQTLIFTNNLCQDIHWNSTIINCKYANIDGNIFNGGSSAGGGIEVLNSLAFSERTVNITNNQFTDNMLRITSTNNPNNVTFVSGNKYTNSELYLEGNVFSGVNYHYRYSERFQTPIEVIGVNQFDDYIMELDGLSSWQNYKISTKTNDSRGVINVNSVNNTRLPIADCLNIPSLHFLADTSGGVNFRWDNATVLEQNVNGSKFENLVITLGDAVTQATLPDLTINYNDVEFINSRFSLSRRTSSDAGDMVINFNDCIFDVSDLATLDLITNNYANTGGTLTLNFNYCLFKSKTSKTLNITSGTAVTGLTINNVSPTYRGVTLN